MEHVSRGEEPRRFMRQAGASRRGGGPLISLWDMGYWALITFATPLIIAVLPFLKVQISERVLHLMLGFSAGILGGVAFADILAEAFAIAKELSLLPIFVPSGIGIGFFILLAVERYLLATQEIHGGPFHIHGKPLDPSHGLMGVSALTFHGFMDGFVIPIGFSAGPQVGIVVTLAVAIHQIPDSFAALSLALGSTDSKKQAFMYVIATAADTPIGILVGLLFVGLGSFMIPLGLGLSAGTFIYVSASDLVRGVHPDARSYLVVLSMALGFMLVLGLSLFMPQV